MASHKLQTVQPNQPHQKVPQTIARDKKFMFQSNSGSSSYSYVSLQIEPCPLEDKYILIEERLKPKDDVKVGVIDMLEIIPHIREAIFDFCKNPARNQAPIANAKFIILDTNYNLVDFKPFRYYECTKMLLEEIFKEIA